MKGGHAAATRKVVALSNAYVHHETLIDSPAIIIRGTCTPMVVRNDVVQVPASADSDELDEVPSPTDNAAGESVTDEPG